MKILETFRFSRRVAAFCFNTVICWFLLEVTSLLRFWRPRIEHINFWVPVWAKINLWIFGIEVQRHGPYLDEGKLYPSLGAEGVGRIFVANHSSALDIPVIFTSAEAHCISRHDVAAWPLIGWGGATSRNVVRRSHQTQERCRCADGSGTGTGQRRGSCHVP